MSNIGRGLMVSFSAAALAVASVSVAPEAMAAGGRGGGSAAQGAALAKGDIMAMQAQTSTCRAGLELLHTNMYVYPADPKVAANGKRAWTDVYGVFKKDHMPACTQVGDFIDKYKDTAGVKKALAYLNKSPETSWHELFYGYIGLIPMGDRVAPYCPALHKSQFDCVSVTQRMDEVDIPGATKILDVLDKL